VIDSTVTGRVAAGQVLGRSRRRKERSGAGLLFLRRHPPSTCAFGAVTVE